MCSMNKVCAEAYSARGAARVRSRSSIWLGPSGSHNLMGDCRPVAARHARFGAGGCRTADPFFDGLPVIVFSGSTTGLSERERKLLRSAALIEKPIQFSQFQETFISLLRSLLEPGDFERATA